MKIFKIKKCDLINCPFFREVGNYNEDLNLCDHEKRYITKFDHCKPKDGDWTDSEIVYVAGSFPSWCPLEDV